MQIGNVLRELGLALFLIVVFFGGLVGGILVAVTVNPWLGYLIEYATAAIILGILAARKNRNYWAWALIGGLVLVPGLIVLMFFGYLCPKCHGDLSTRQWQDRTCPVCGVIG